MRSVMWHPNCGELWQSGQRGSLSDCEDLGTILKNYLLIKLFNKMNDPLLKYHQVNLKREDVSCTRDAWFSSQRGLQMSSDTFFLDKRGLLGDRNCCSVGLFRCCTSRGSQLDILRSFYAHSALLCPHLSECCRRHQRQIEM